MRQNPRIYVDVGAHRGAALAAAMHPRFGFTHLHAIEPSAACCDFLRSFRDQRLTVHEVALSDHDGAATLYAAGSVGGSLYADKRYKPHHDPSERVGVQMRDASAWIHEFTAEDTDLFLKMNCEGGEAAVLTSLARTGSLGRISSLLIDFDVRKVNSLADKEDELRQLLREGDVDYLERANNSGLSVPDTVTKWLGSRIPAQSTSFPRRLGHAAGRNHPAGVVRNRRLAALLKRIGLGRIVNGISPP